MSEKSDVLLKLEVRLASGFIIEGMQQLLTAEQYKTMRAIVEMAASGEASYLAVQTGSETTVFVTKKLLEDAIILMRTK